MKRIVTRAALWHSRCRGGRLAQHHLPDALGGIAVQATHLRDYVPALRLRAGGEVGWCAGSGAACLAGRPAPLSRLAGASFSNAVAVAGPTR